MFTFKDNGFKSYGNVQFFYQKFAKKLEKIDKEKHWTTLCESYKNGSIERTVKVQ